MTTSAAELAETKSSGGAGGYIVSPRFDHAFIIWAPLQWLCIGGLIWGLDIADLSYAGLAVFPVFAVTFAIGHIVAGLFRSHANGEVRRRYWVRLLVVPLVFLLLMNVSKRLLLTFAVFLVWFDIWHSSMQTFGFARLYDRAAGNDSNVGRKLDMGMALITYASPILAGVAFAHHLRRVPWLESIGVSDAAMIQLLALKNQSYLSWVVVAFDLVYTAIYIGWYWRLSKQGYNVSWQKVALWISMATCATLTWGFDSFLQAYLIMECFHAFQYYAIVWWSEKKRIQSLFRLPPTELGKAGAFVLFMAVSLAGGFWAAVYAVSMGAMSVVLMLEGLHYWSDGFVWSVRKKMI